MSDTIIWALIWASWVIFGQVCYYYLIERQSLQKEREFSFRKERYFLTEKTVLEILDTLLKIDTIIREMNAELHWWVFSSLHELVNSKDSLQNKLLYMENIESSIKIYFPKCTQDFQAYRASLYNLYNIHSESQNTWLVDSEWRKEYGKYEKSKENFEKKLIDSLESTKLFIS